MRDTVLVLTHWFDPTADSVVRVLHKRGVPVSGAMPRISSADFDEG